MNEAAVSLEQVNSWIAAGAAECGTAWKEKSRIRSVLNFKGNDIQTHAKMFSCKECELEEEARKLGRGGAELFNRLWNEAGKPDEWREVVLLMGAECPRADAVDREGDMIVVRGYFDFGITLAKKARGAE